MTNYIFSYFILLFIFLHLSWGQDEIQRVEFYRNANCTLLIGVKTDTDLVVSTQANYSSAASVFVRGMWAITRRESAALTTTTKGWFNNECHARTQRELSYEAIVRFGPASMKSSSLTLYTEGSYNGIGFAQNGDGSSIVLPRSLMSLSYHMAGLDEWAVYSNTDYTGNVTCIKPRTEVIQTGHGFTFALNNKLVAGSAKKGCEGSNNNANSNVFSHAALLISLFVGIKNFHLIL